MAFEIREATPQDIQYIAEHMREICKREMWDSHRMNMQDLQKECEELECLVALHNDIPFALFGCRLHEEKHVPWLISTDEIKEVSTAFLRGSKRIAEQWLNEYGILTSYVHAANIISIHWLTWLGFKLKGSFPVNDIRILCFERCR